MPYDLFILTNVLSNTSQFTKGASLGDEFICDLSTTDIIK